MPRIAAVTCAALLTLSPFGVHVVRATDTTVPMSTDTTVAVWDLENEPSQCVNSNPRPNCGKKPVQAGDRGGALQYATFAVMMAGLGTIGTVLVRNTVRRDRAIAEEMRNRNGS